VRAPTQIRTKNSIAGNTNNTNLYNPVIHFVRFLRFCPFVKRSVLIQRYEFNATVRIRSFRFAPLPVLQKRFFDVKNTYVMFDRTRIIVIPYVLLYSPRTLSTVTHIRASRKYSPLNLRRHNLQQVVYSFMPSDFVRSADVKWEVFVVFTFVA